MQKIFITLFYILLSVLLHAQKADILISGNFNQTPFSDFVSAVERSSGVRFFFDDPLVANLRVTGSGNPMSLANILKNTLAATELRFFIDNYHNVIIYNSVTAFIDDLSENKTDVSMPDLPGQHENGGLTSSEKKYREGKITQDNETIICGTRQQNFSGRSCVVRGKITDAESGEPLIGATLYIKETGTGAATDADGYFRIVLKSGRYSAKVSCMSMKEKEFNLEVYGDGTLPLKLEKKLISIGEITVTGDKNNNVTGIQMGFDKVTTRNMKEIPVALGERDLLKVAQLLPGVQTAGEGSSGLIVRGGTADQNLFYLNKVPIYNTSHLFGFFTAFSPDVVSDFTLYKSNIPASYGGRVSSVFDITTRQGNKKKFFGQGGISPITGHFELEGPVVKNNTSFVVSARSSYSDWILKKMNDINLKNSNAGFYDFTAGINSEINNQNLIKVFGYTSSDQFTLSNTDDYRYANQGGMASWKHLFSSSLTFDLSAIYSQYWFSHNNKKNLTEAYSHKYVLDHKEFKADFNLLTKGNHKIQFGAGAILYHLNRGDILPFGEESRRSPVELGEENGVESAAYISDEFALFPKLTLQTGLRYSFYGQLGPAEITEYASGLPKTKANIENSISVAENKFAKTYSGPELRFAANYRFGSNNSIKTSYNRIRQYIFMLSNTMAVSPDDQWKLTDYHIKPPVSDQISFGYYHDLPDKGYSSSVEIYRKWTNDIVEYKDGVSFISDEKTETQLLQRRQDTYGVELMLKKTSGNNTGWISYTYSKSTILVNSNIPDDRINFGKRYPSNYDRPHSLNMVANLRYSRRISSSFNVVYSTGRPITYPLAVYLYENKYLLHYSGRNQYRLPDYFRVDYSLNMEGNLLSKKSIHSSWMLNVFNLLGRKNAYSVFFESDKGRIRGYKLSVFAQPIITLSWNFKFGNYANE